MLEKGSLLIRVLVAVEANELGRAVNSEFVIGGLCCQDIEYVVLKVNILCESSSGVATSPQNGNFSRICSLNNFL